MAAGVLIACATLPAADFVLVAHGGAGDYSKMSAGLIAARRDGLTQAIRAGYTILAHGGTSMDAVEATIRVMEDSGLFDAGRGAYYMYLAGDERTVGHRVSGA